MGTTAQKLQAVLNSKNAIKTKFNLPDNLPFSQYAENIKAGDGGDSDVDLGTVNIYKDFQPSENIDGTLVSTGEPVPLENLWIPEIKKPQIDNLTLECYGIHISDFHIGVAIYFSYFSSREEIRQFASSMFYSKNGGEQISLIEELNKNGTIRENSFNPDFFDAELEIDKENWKKGDKISLVSYNPVFSTNDRRITISCHGGSFIAYGNIMSLLNYADSCSEWCFKGLFSGSSITDATNLKLPVNLSIGCFHDMFSGSHLTAPPELPATQLAPWCYSNMFRDMPYLATPPELPATQLAESCYSNMFEDSEKLEKAPYLPARELPVRELPTGGCYYKMFYGCTSLREIRVNFIVDVIDGLDMQTKYFDSLWVYRTNDTGKFYKPSALSLPERYIPEGWEVINIDEVERKEK